MKNSKITIKRVAEIITKLNEYDDFFPSVSVIYNKKEERMSYDYILNGNYTLYNDNCVVVSERFANDKYLSKNATYKLAKEITISLQERLSNII